MKLKYWIADCLNDHERHSPRARTKKECLAKRAQQAQRNPSHSYGQPRKVAIYYIDRFDLILMAASQEGLYEIWPA